MFETKVSTLHSESNAMDGIVMPWERNDVTLCRAPYPYGWVSDFLPTALYTKLASSFVEPDTHPGLEVLGKRKKRVSFMTPPTPDSLGEIPSEWQDFLDLLSREKTIARALDWVRHLIPLDALPEGPYRELFALRHALTPDQLCWYCEFSSLDASVFLPPHSDSTDKLLIFVLYFTPDGWQEYWDGATEVYSALDADQNGNFSNFFLSHDRVALLDRCDYLPNRAFFFVKNHAAWHGVSPVRSEATLKRRSFNFSLRVRPDAVLSPRMVALIDEVRAREALTFPR